MMKMIRNHRLVPGACLTISVYKPPFSAQRVRLRFRHCKWRNDWQLQLVPCSCEHAICFGDWDISSGVWRQGLKCTETGERSPRVGLLLGHLRRWPNSKPTRGQRLVFEYNRTVSSVFRNLNSFSTAAYKVFGATLKGCYKISWIR